MPRNIDAHKPIQWTFLPLPPDAFDRVQEAMRKRLMKEIEDQFCLPQRLFFPGGFKCQPDTNYSSTTGKPVQLAIFTTDG